MAVTELLFGGRTHLQVGIIQFDASVTETHTDEAEISDHPVEDGSDVTDHITKKPISLEVKGLITNTPIVWLASISAKSPLLGDLYSQKERVNAAYDMLQQYMDYGEIFDVVTSLRAYEDMAIRTMTVARNARTGNVLDCMLTLRQIQFAETISIALPKPIDIGNKGKKNKGKKKKQTASQQQMNKELEILASFGAYY